ncbi:MAG: phosphoribosylaminoimidazolesuccinocarboxamide synthase [Phycisphaera sp.]|nr:phosphoribosylaminoimidazolesuccinocarboxamide synthase [Phycisphaera sp.]
MSMQNEQSVMRTDLPLANRRQGKVRDVYDAKLDDGREVVVLVATDRLSAFDVVMPTPVPGKGKILTQVSRFWFEMIGKKLGHFFKHHLMAIDATHVAGLSDEQRAMLKDRVMVGVKTRVVPIECVVRGYLAGSGWKEYQKTQSVCGVKLPSGLRQSEKLPGGPIFTPATKAASGHDENIDFERACEIVGRDLMTKLHDWSIAIYTMAHDYAATRGIIVADTKFEFGLPVGGSSDPILIDEVLTPDSSRFWPADQYEPGRDQHAFDKQYVRNYLEGLVAQGKWAKSPPGPELPAEVVQQTLKRYLDAYRLLTQA